jgi:hypothetical protein
LTLDEIKKINISLLENDDYVINALRNLISFKVNDLVQLDEDLEKKKLYHFLSKVF